MQCGLGYGLFHKNDGRPASLIITCALVLEQTLVKYFQEKESRDNTQTIPPKNLS
jgi:hypothetical protein